MNQESRTPTPNYMILPSIEKRKEEFEQVLKRLRHEFTSVRTGRAHPALVEELMVESYDSASPLKNLAGISVDGALSLVIQPWDRGILANIETAIRNSNLGLQPINDGGRIRLTLPALTEERRRELVKLVGQMAEASRVRIRNIREDIWREVTQLVKAKQLTEDDKYQAQEQLKKLVDDYNQRIKELLEKKEAEIMTV